MLTPTSEANEALALAGEANISKLARLTRPLPLLARLICRS